MLAVQIDDPFLCLYSPFAAVFGRGHDRVPFAPHAEVAHVDESHVRVAVVAFGHRPQEVFRLFEEHRVVVFRFHELPVHVVPAGSRVENPFRRGMIQPAFGGRDPEGHLTSAVDPSLRGRVEQFPDETSLFGFEERPRYAEIDGSQTRKVVHRVGGLQSGAVVGQYVGVEVHRPSHAGIEQRPAVVAEFDPIPVRPLRKGFACRGGGVVGFCIHGRRGRDEPGTGSRHQSGGENTRPAQKGSSVYFFHRFSYGAFPTKIRKTVGIRKGYGASLSVFGTGGLTVRRRLVRRKKCMDTCLRGLGDVRSVVVREARRSVRAFVPSCFSITPARP